MNLNEKVHQLPTSPGVYLMRDSRGSIIYIGKAKNLKNRVKTYFQNSMAHPPKIKKMQALIHDFAYIGTDTEFEAFLLENKLIKAIRPLFNTQLKSPQKYKYIAIHINERYPQIELSDHCDDKRNLYFGPFSSKHRVEKAIQGIKEFYKLCCSGPSYKNSPCLNYSLGLCMGTCFGKPTVAEYKRIMDQIIGLLQGTNLEILDKLDQLMSAASLNYEFETAAKYRDYIDAIHSLIHKEKVLDFVEENHNIAIIEFIRKDALKLFLIKRNKVLFSENYRLNSMGKENLTKVIKAQILFFFPIHSYLTKKLDKKDLDEAQIIYRYLKGNECDYIIIPDYLLEIGNEQKLEADLFKLVDIVLNKTLTFSAN